MRVTLAIVSVATCVVLLVPAVTGDDSFPISSHPMYATARSGEDELVTAEGFDAAGSLVHLSMEVIADTDDPLIARQRMADAAASGRAENVCRSIADRAPDSVATIEVVAVRHDVRSFAGGDSAPLTRQLLARCTVR